MMRYFLIALLSAAIVFLAACASTSPDQTRQALQFPAGQPLDSGRKSHRNRRVETRLRVGKAIVNAPPKTLNDTRVLPEPPKRKQRRLTPKYRQLEGWSEASSAGSVNEVERRSSNKGISTNVFDAIDFETNADNTGGTVFIPADPALAAGPNHLVLVTNTSIAIYNKSGTELDSESLQDFFSPLSPPTFTFDPKVIFDQFENRFVVLTLERQDIADGDDVNASRILLAVSDSADPTGSWSVAEIDGFETINTNDHWVDFPGLAVDEEAVYITANMFQFFNQGAPGDFGGSRVWIVEKGVNNGFYDGDSIDVTRYNPFTSGATFAGTHQPAHVFGTPPTGNTGTWLVLHSGLFNGTQEEAQLVEITSPLGSAQFNFDFVSLGNIDNNTSIELDNLPQDNSSEEPDAGDRRTLDAVWRDNSLYFTAATRARSGADAGEVTAFWAEVNTQTNNLNQLGLLGGEDIASNTVTAFGAVAVNDGGVIALGFTSANANSFLSSHYALHFPGDSAGSNQGSELIRAGTDIFELSFGGSEVRWGDYSSVALDPNGACFWIYNKHAIDRGSATDGEIGRWGTAVAEVCENQPPAPVADALTVAEGGSVTETDDSDDSLLDNDSDPDGDNLNINTTPITLPGVGTVTIDNNGEFVYTHDGSDSSNDLFRYEVCDDGDPLLCAQAQVNVVITEVNDPPEAADDSGFTITEDDTDNIDIADLIANDSVGDIGTSQTLDIIDVDQASGGTATLRSSDVRFVTDNNFFGSASFRYTVEDDGTTDGSNDPLTDTALVTINVTEVNDPPLAGDDAIADLAEDVVYMIPFATLLDNDSPGPANESAQTLTINRVVNDVGGRAELGSGMVIFTPTAEFSGAARFDYRIADNGTTNGNPAPADDVGRVTFTIVAVNDPPVAAPDTLADVPEDSVDVTIAVSSLLANDEPGPSNESGQDLNLTAVANPIGGTAAIDGTNIVFTLNPGFNGAAGFSYTVTDNGESGGAPDPRSADGQVSFNIVGDNDSPIVVADSLTVARGQTAVLLDTADSRLLTNDSDPENGQLTVTTTPVTLPTQGTVTLAPDGSFVYEHNGVDFTPDSFRYEACDDGSPVLCAAADVTVNVVEVPFGRCDAAGSRVVVGLLVALPAAGLFEDPRGDFAAQGLPPSLSIDAGNGVISGIPTTADLAGSPYDVTVTSSGAPRNFTLVISPDTEVIFFSGLEDDCL